MGQARCKDCRRRSHATIHRSPLLPRGYIAAGLRRIAPARTEMFPSGADILHARPQYANSRPGQAYRGRGVADTGGHSCTQRP